MFIQTHLDMSLHFSSFSIQIRPFHEDCCLVINRTNITLFCHFSIATQYIYIIYVYIRGEKTEIRIFRYFVNKYKLCEIFRLCWYQQRSQRLLLEFEIYQNVHCRVQFAIHVRSYGLLNFNGRETVYMIHIFGLEDASNTFAHCSFLFDCFKAFISFIVY